MNRLLTVIALLGLTVSAFAANKKVYEWVDASGVKHYQDAPPPRGTPNVKVMNVHTSTPPSQQPPSNDAAAGNGQAKPARPQTTANMSPEQRAAACQTARRNLQLLQSNPAQGLHTTTAGGKTVQITPKNRAAQIATATQQIRIFCR